MKALFSKRRFLVALTAALLISAALVASCIDQVIEQGDDNIVIPEGKGLVRIKVGKINRTIYPDSLPNVNTLYYTIAFTKTSGGSGTTNYPESGRSAYSALEDIPIALDAATYTITVTAWSAVTGGNEVAGWTGTGIVVATGSSTPVAVDLKGWTAGGTGTFTYSITVPAAPTGWTLTVPPSGYSTATLEIRDSTNKLVAANVDNDTNPPENIPIPLVVGPNTHTAYNSYFSTIPAGYYTLKITLSADKCQDRVYEDVIHIYQGLPSSFSYAVPAVNQDEFTVKFNLNGHPADDPTNSFLVNMGVGNDYRGLDVQGSIPNAGDVAYPGTPVTADPYVFEGWYTATTGGTKFTIGTTKVFYDLNLYARWEEEDVTGTEFTFTFAVSDAYITPSSDDPISYAGITAPVNAQVLTFTLNGGASYSGIVWTIDGETLASGTTATIEKTIDASLLAKFLVKGTHVVTVKGTKDGQPYVGYITFTVNN